MMASPLQLSRPLVVFDLETTGTDPSIDRIVEIGIVRIEVDGSRRTKSRRLNPEIPIPPEATLVHQISDADVQNEPTFKQVAKSLRDEWLSDCDLCGYNLVKFDLRMLRAEFMRVGEPFPLEGRAIVDPMMIYHMYERRDLGAATRFYLNREHENAHEALADAIVTADILEVMLEKYPLLPKSPEEMHALLKPEHYEDVAGKFRREQGILKVNFGKNRGISVAKVLENDRTFFEWMMEQDFHRDTKRVCWNILNGKIEL